MRYRDFERDARDYFGLDKNEAVILAARMSEAGFDTREWRRDDPLFWDIAADLAEIAPEEEEEEWPLDPMFPDDDYLDADEEWELTADYEAD